MDSDRPLLYSDSTLFGYIYYYASAGNFCYTARKPRNFILLICQSDCRSDSVPFLAGDSQGYWRMRIISYSFHYHCSPILWWQHDCYLDCTGSLQHYDNLLSDIYYYTSSGCGGLFTGE